MNREHTFRHPIAWSVVGAAMLIAAAGCQKAPENVSPREFEARLRPLVSAHDYAAADSLISHRERSHPGDAEVYVSRGNLYFQMAFRSMLGGPGAAGDTARRAPDTLLIRRAIESLREGIRVHPQRLDMRFGLAYMLQQLGIPEGEFEVLSNAVDYARAHPDSLRWTYGEPLPASPDEYVPQVLHDYVRFYLDRDQPGDDVVMLAIARLSSEAYPRNNRATNDVAYYYGTRGEWQRSLEFLRRAEKSDSTDALVLYNLGWTHENLGHRSLAARYYNRAVAAGEAGRLTDIAQSARDRLAQLRVANSAATPVPTPAPEGSTAAPQAPPARPEPAPKDTTG